jgi:hypothetical protein
MQTVPGRPAHESTDPWIRLVFGFGLHRMADVGIAELPTECRCEPEPAPCRRMHLCRTHGPHEFVAHWFPAGTGEPPRTSPPEVRGGRTSTRAWERTSDHD